MIIGLQQNETKLTVHLLWIYTYYSRDYFRIPTLTIKEGRLAFGSIRVVVVGSVTRNPAAM